MEPPYQIWQDVYILLVVPIYHTIMIAVSTWLMLESLFSSMLARGAVLIGDCLATTRSWRILIHDVASTLQGRVPEVKTSGLQAKIRAG